MALVSSYQLAAHQVTDTNNYTLYTCSQSVGPAKGVTLTRLTICNADSSARTVRVWIVRSGGSAGSDNRELYDVTVPANDTMVYPLEGCGLLNGDSVVVRASSANVVNFVLWGAEVR